MIGLKRGELLLLPHSPEWKAFFWAEQTRIRQALGDKRLRIEHIGSTSIPGILAKPIIDIGVGIPATEDGSQYVAVLETLAYLYKGENGIAGRHYFRTDDETVKHHIHMFPDSHPKLQDHLLFRDFLIQNPALAREYNQLKLRLLEQYPNDRLQYTEGKSTFIGQVLKLARKKP